MKDEPAIKRGERDRGSVTGVSRRNFVKGAATIAAVAAAVPLEADASWPGFCRRSGARRK